MSHAHTGGQAPDQASSGRQTGAAAHTQTDHSQGTHIAASHLTSHTLHGGIRLATAPDRLAESYRHPTASGHAFDSVCRATLGGGCPEKSRVSRKVVPGKVVVVADLRDIDVAKRAQAGRLVQRSGRDADRVACGCVPEQTRPALGAEPAPGLALALGTGNPTQSTVFQQNQVFLSCSRGREYVPAPPSALHAVA